ncbi:hypothetical protein B0H16DRAFT_1585999 [Mycena metata]|uniref:Uncharacterized protein n=1 Tax=Mycena metata TaxID=1033252 RepID=A0AAD7MSF6_9AGAR|nr:hypothetical protein B0H16DRAFT_1585999 [Mycena metata]
MPGPYRQKMRIQAPLRPERHPILRIQLRQPHLVVQHAVHAQEHRAVCVGEVGRLPAIRKVLENLGDLRAEVRARNMAARARVDERQDVALLSISRPINEQRRIRIPHNTPRHAHIQRLLPRDHPPRVLEVEERDAKGAGPSGGSERYAVRELALLAAVDAHEPVVAVPVVRRTVVDLRRRAPDAGRGERRGCALELRLCVGNTMATGIVSILAMVRDLQRLRRKLVGMISRILRVAATVTRLRRTRGTIVRGRRRRALPMATPRIGIRRIILLRVRGVVESGGGARHGGMVVCNCKAR